MNYNARYGDLNEYRKLVAIAHRECLETCCYCLIKFPKGTRGVTEIHHTRYLGKKDKLGINYFLVCIGCHVIAHLPENWFFDFQNPVWGSHATEEFEQQLQSNFLLITSS